MCDKTIAANEGFFFFPEKVEKENLCMKKA